MNTVLKYMLDQIDKAEIVENPYPYFIIDGILPDEFYAGLIDQLPISDDYRVFFLPHQKKGIKLREQLVIQNDLNDPTSRNKIFDVQGIDECLVTHNSEINKSPNWKIFRDILVSQALEQKLRKKLEPYFRTGYQTNVPVQRQIGINRDQPGFQIEPHTDTETKLVVGLFYLAENEYYPHLGTNIHRHKHDLRSLRTTPENVQLDPKDFQLVKHVEYLPNRLFVFAKTDNSWHSVKIAPNPIDRYTVYYSLFQS